MTSTTRSRFRPSHLVAALGAAGAMTLAGCSTNAEDPDANVNASDSPAESASLNISAAFYALTFVAGEVAGDRANVTQLTPTGVSPHDLELSPSAVLDLGDSDLALYLSDFQGAVDDAVAETGVLSLNVADVIELREFDLEDGHGHDDDDDDHADEDEGAHDAGDTDPHFWLDPTLLAQIGEAVAERLTELDPEGAAEYTANAADFGVAMSALDDSYTTGLATCARDTIVVTHAAYGYLTERHGLIQVGMSDLDPEAEPSASTLLEIQEIVAETGVTTIFTEDELTQSVADALASDTGTSVAVLATGGAVESDDDYISLMSRNLDALRTALDCE